MLRHVFAGLTAMVVLALSATAQGATTDFTARFKEFFGKASAHACTGGFFVCGVGTVAGYGQATSGVEILDFTDFDPSTACGSTTVRRTITLSSGEGSLVLTESGTVCFPGRSFFTPGASSGHSYGNPTRLSLTWAVTSATGVFAGASGTGTDSSGLAGDAGHSSLSGTLTLP